MKTISGFTYGHNLISSGYPIVEAIRAVQPYVNEVLVVDMQSTDNTREVLDKLSETCLGTGKFLAGIEGCDCAAINIVDGLWGNQAGETLRQAHNNYVKCTGDIIIHFEADEVYEDRLIRSVVSHIKAGHTDLAVHRLQIEQNFQRCRWYPEPVHRVFPRLSNTRKEGHTTDQHTKAFTLEPKNGYLWDITNCFRDNWMNRVKKQAELRNTKPQYIMTPLHALHKAELTEAEAQKWLMSGKHWTWTNTPFAIPEILRDLVGMTKYEST